MGDPVLEGMRRIDARNYAVYLQRRVEDYGDAERLLPKWTEIDRDAVRDLVREFRRSEHSIPVPQVFDDDVDQQESAMVAVLALNCPPLGVEEQIATYVDTRVEFERFDGGALRDLEDQEPLLGRASF